MKIYGNLDIEGEIQNVTTESLPEDIQPETQEEDTDEVQGTE